MEETQKHDLTTGGIMQKLLVITLPVMGTQLIQMLYNFTDIFWLGKVSSVAVAASGSAGMFMWLSMGPMMFGRMCAEIGVSQNTGMGKPDIAKRFSQNAVLIALVLGVIFGGAMVLFPKQLISFFNIQEADVAADAAVYLAIVGVGIPFTYISAAASGTFGGSGNTKMPFFISTIGIGINLVLDPTFILLLGMGVRGAAISTTFGQIVVCALSLLALRRSKSRPFEDFKLLVKPHLETIKRAIKWGAPVCIESMLFCFLSMIIARLIASYGAPVIAAQKIGGQIESMTWLVGGGFGTAFAMFIGQNYGAGKWSRIHKGYRTAVRLMIVWGACATALCLFGGRAMANIFVSDADTINVTVQYLRILAICELIYCLEVISVGAFRGMGKTMPPAIITISVNILRVPFVYLLSQSPLGLDGVWLGISLGSFARSAAIVIWYVIHSSRQPKDDVEITPAQLPAT